MATQAQIHANRKNAEKSTGPRTPEGKAKASQNAVTHGLRAQRDIIIGEDPAELEAHREQMLAELAPAGAMETMLAERIVHLSWRLKRAERIQNEVFDALHAQVITSPIARLVQSLTPKGPDGEGQFGPDGEDYALGRVVLRDFSNCRVLDRLLMYERRIENSLYRTMAELQKLRLMREIDPPVEPPTPKGARGAGDESIVPNKANCRARPLGCARGDTGAADKAVCGAQPTRSASGRDDEGPGEDRAEQTQSAGPGRAEAGTDAAEQTQSAGDQADANGVSHAGLGEKSPAAVAIRAS